MQSNLQIGNISIKVYTSADINDVQVKLPYTTKRGTILYLEGDVEADSISLVSTGSLDDAGQETLEDLITLLKLIKKYQ